MDSRSGSAYFRRVTGLGVVVALLVTTFAPAMAASQAPPTDPPSFSTKSIAKVVANTKPAADASKTPAQATKSGSFFKTRTGLVVIAVMAVGTGYALYSSSHDRIRGSIR